MPLLDVPQKLPSYLSVDRHSAWQRSALLSSAVESVSLPSRLRPYHDFEASLAGDDGRHNIYELQTSFNPPKTNDESSTKPRRTFDINFSYESPDKDTTTIFNQVQVYRGSEPRNSGEFSAQNDIGHTRKLRFYNSEPMLQRWDEFIPNHFVLPTDLDYHHCLSYRSPLRLPVLDSFPHELFSGIPSNVDGMSVVTALTASTRTGEQIKMLQATAARMLSVDEREAMVHGLGEIRENYETGWSSGSSDDEDD